VVFVSESGRLFGRKRRANAPADQPRTKRYTVKVSPDEDAKVRARAEVLGVTVPRLMFDAAVSSRAALDVEWRSIGSELMQLRTLMGRISANINQLARFANTEGRFPAEAEAIAAEYRALVPRVEATLKRLAGE
jgi:hypothetical protein